MAFGTPAVEASGWRAERFPEVVLRNGTVIPAHVSLSGDPSDLAAARRRQELAGSPYRQLGERRWLRRGEILAVFESSIARERRDRIADDVEAIASALFDRDAWPKPYSNLSPLQVLLVSKRSGDESVAVAGWEGRERSRGLFRPLIAVEVGDRGADAVRIDLAHQLALLTVRQSAPEEAGWVAEGMAEWLARRVFGLVDEPTPETDLLLAESGTLRDPATLALFLEHVSRSLDEGPAAIRSTWEEAGFARGDDAEAFVRELADRVDGKGLATVFADLLVSRLGAPRAELRLLGDTATRTGLPIGDVAIQAPGRLAFRRLSLRRLDEPGGLEIGLASTCGSSGRALLLYRGDRGRFDSVRLEPGVSEVLPLSGAELLSVILVDGAGDADQLLHVRRVVDYPAVLSSAATEIADGAVHVTWRTLRHRGLLAWVVSRTEVGEPDMAASTERERERVDLVPTVEESESGMSYHLVDRDAAPGKSYRYRVSALTANGFLSEAARLSIQIPSAP